MVTVAQVASASRGELLCLTYELLLEELIKAIDGEAEVRKASTQKSIQILQVLAEGLDFEFDLAKDLFRIYVYVQGLLIKGRTSQSLEEAHRLVETLYVGYKTICTEEEDKQPVMQNTDKVYAGLTYGRGMLNESLGEGYNRGYKA